MLNTLPSNFASAVTPFAPLGRAPVGQESAELKASSFKPLEEGAESARGENRRATEDRPSEVEERERTRADAAAKAVEAQELKERQGQIAELAKRDREVRAHERAHAAAGGQFAGAPSYETTRGPDGVNYAVAGEVKIDTSPVAGDPQATLEKALQVHAAAMAPAEPSSQDRLVAADASRMAADARAELAQLVREDLAQSQAPAGDEEQDEASPQAAAAGSDDDTAAPKAPLPINPELFLYSSGANNAAEPAAGLYSAVDLRA
ncbi:putative metalloprotease CJM1_0395 family protein [Gilvimarinus polysaccharolyticus]|uniref:putative metalloprotease CJM1_0395 family protein n=1 Tax=Gilvimarinus polysaccharolyticus TaxID=863921 RepID=UPI000673BE73|nr:putative metalloprotease CJM1_0395 family protein [Gilvimarinus polysaccharolyticus]